jgi:hypothetical protein
MLIVHALEPKQRKEDMLFLAGRGVRRERGHARWREGDEIVPRAKYWRATSLSKVGERKSQVSEEAILATCLASYFGYLFS